MPQFELPCALLTMTQTQDSRTVDVCSYFNRF